MRKPSLKKSFKARTTGRLKRQVKRAVIPMYGKKGTGWIKNPKKALYNKVYHKATFGLSDLARLASSTSKKQPIPKKRKAKQPKQQGDFMKKFFKWLAYFIEACVIFVFSPIFIILGIIGLWFFTKKKPNKKLKNLSFIATIISIVGIIAIATHDPKKDEPKITEPSSTLISSSSSSRSSTSSSSSDTTSTTSAASSSSSSNSSSSSTTEQASTTPSASSEPASAEPPQAQSEQAQPAPAPTPTPEPEPAPQEEPQAGGGYFRDARGRWHRSNGQYASKAEIAAAGLPW